MWLYNWHPLANNSTVTNTVALKIIIKMVKVDYYSYDNCNKSVISKLTGNIVTQKNRKLGKIKTKKSMTATHICRKLLWFHN